VTAGDVATTVPVRYVALGDSYTIGTSVAPHERFPDQLVAALRDEAAGPALELVANLGVNGFTSADLIRDELPALGALAPGFVSLCIGVNDVVQGVPLATYEARVADILDAVVALVGSARIVVIAVPDYTVTPAGSDYGDPAERRAAIGTVNAAMARQARERGIAIVDIVDISREVGVDRSLVAGDGLHPSGAQYARWVARLAPVVRSLLAV